VSSYAKVGLTGSYAWKLDNAKLTFQLNVDNLLDTRYYSEGTVGPLGVYVGQPRTFKPKNSSRRVFDGMRIMHY
jgi:outer membrane receptor protein involved in Fe transport